MIVSSRQGPVETADSRPIVTRRRGEIARLPVDIVSPHELIACAIEAVERGGPLRIHTLNVDHVVIAHLRPRFFDVVTSADLVVADGMPIVWSLRARHPHVQRVTGTDTMAALLAHDRGLRVFLLGGRAHVAEAVRDKVLEMHLPGQVVGVLAPPRTAVLDEPESASMVAAINASKADVLFVALGSPLQEEWLATHAGVIDSPVVMGVGAAFDFLSGRIRRAPEKIQRMGLEWAYRIIQDPVRLLQRYLVRDWLFLWLLAKYGVK